jgi:hypothetical protein
MSVFPGSPRVLKGAFVRFDTGQQPKIIVFPYNPETLCRTIQPVAQIPEAAKPAPAAPFETIEFTLLLDATDSLAEDDTQAVNLGVYPLLSAIELLMYGTSAVPSPVTLFIWGPNRIIPVSLTELRIAERLFEPNLSPVQASVHVTLTVVSAANLTAGSPGLEWLLRYIASLEGLASTGYAPSTAASGVNLASEPAPPSTGAP